MSIGTAIVITSGKGGTGKTSTAAGVAACLAAMGHRTLCLDGDIGLRNLDLVLGMTDQALMDFTDVIEHRCSLERAAVEHRELKNLFLLTAPVTLPAGVDEDGMRRLKKNKIAMVSFVFIIAIAIFAYLLPAVWPYSYSEQMKGSNNLKPFEYSASEQARIDAGEKVFPHILGTDRMGRDFAVRIMMGTRVSLSVGLIASVLVLIIGATYGAVAAFAGGWVDNIMMRITDILYTIPDILLIILLGMALKDPLDALATKPGFKWMQTLGPNMISIFIIFALLYWVGMARIVRSQILILKESEYVTAARALGASSGRIIKKHLLTNCIGTLIVTTTLQIPASIFTESYLSFIGLGVAAPLPSLGSLFSLLSMIITSLSN